MNQYCSKIKQVGSILPRGFLPGYKLGCIMLASLLQSKDKLIKFLW